MTETANLISQETGVVPISVNHENGLIKWSDITNYHIYEGAYKRGLQSYQAIRSLQSPKKIEPEITTNLSEIDNIDVPKREPDLIIFHMSRCGSTLMTKALAQSRKNNIFGEPGILFPAIHYLKCQNAPNEIIKSSIYKLFSSLGRQRLQTHENFIVKLSSLETFAMPLLQEIYPRTKMLFIYRHPIEVIVSNIEKAALFMRHRVNSWNKNPFNQMNDIDDIEYLTTHISNCMQEALRLDHDSLNLLNYSDLTSENLHTIMDVLGLSFTSEEKHKMQLQFSQYSKADNKKQNFVPDGAEKLKSASDEIWEAYENHLQQIYQQLCQASNNLFLPR